MAVAGTGVVRHDDFLSMRMKVSSDRFVVVVRGFGVGLTRTGAVGERIGHGRQSNARRDTVVTLDVPMSSLGAPK
ncbi:hypothetical protein ASD66_12670 [Nocardioides sp. Root151]|nr:hypothetical protein ASD66_12670 [Nocardioides sp. Root151]